MSDETTSTAKGPLAGVFHKSVSPYSKALSLHPHLYGGELYNRASELRALDKLVGQLKIVEEQVKAKDYRALGPILNAIKDALSGNPKLSWWNLVTISIGQAFTEQEDEDEKNIQERHYLTEISKVLTEIIRTYQSPNTKLLLEIRLTALEVDSRLIELEKLPGTTSESAETLEYLASEFRLLNKELQTLTDTPQEGWKGNLNNLISLIKKSNQLLQIINGLSTSNPDTYRLFCKKDHLQTLASKLSEVIGKCRLIPATPEKMTFWDASNLNEFFTLLTHFPAIIDNVTMTDLTTLLIHLEQLFVNDKSPDKKRPEIFSSNLLKQMIAQKDIACAKIVDQVKAAVKAKAERSMAKDLAAFYKARLMDENDLHTLCGMVRYKPQDYPPPAKTPPQTQKDCLLRMHTLANSSQPRDLDSVLKSFTTEEMATRYYLLQEIILEQFIYWRKHGIF